MATSPAVVRASFAKGELAEFDMRKIRQQAAPKWKIADDAGIDPETVREMLDRMIEILGFPGASNADNDMQTALKLIRQLLRNYENGRDAAEITLATYERCVADGNLAAATETMQTLRECVAPIARVILY